jgi:quinol-cytochrome oxidoreductase complex cytochrome b subunit
MATNNSPIQPSPAPAAPQNQKSYKGLSVWSLVFSILGLLTIIIPIVGLVFGIVSAILAGLYVKRVGLNGFYTYTIVLLSGFAVFFGIITLIAFIAFGGSLINDLSNL